MVNINIALALRLESNLPPCRHVPGEGPLRCSVFRRIFDETVIPGALEAMILLTTIGIEHCLVFGNTLGWSLRWIYLSKGLRFKSKELHSVR
jgi:hypothetical protein